MLPVKQIIEGLAQCTGTEQYWKNPLLHFQYTYGVKFLWESADCYWLLIAISSYRRSEPFQIWNLKKNPDDTAILSMQEDSDRPILVEQKIRYTNFPLEEIKLWLIDGILLLPSEY